MSETSETKLQDPEWVRRMADEEDKHPSISAGSRQPAPCGVMLTENELGHLAFLAGLHEDTEPEMSADLLGIIERARDGQPAVASAPGLTEEERFWIGKILSGCGPCDPEFHVFYKMLERFAEAEAALAKGGE